MTTIIKVIYWVSITFLLLAAASIAHCQNPQYRQPSFVDHAQSANMHSLTSDGGTSAASGGSNDNIPKQHQPEESLGDAARRLRAQRTDQPKAKIQYVN
jgi:hypothetical protein